MALIELASPVEINSRVNFPCLPDDGNDVPNLGSECVLAGPFTCHPFHQEPLFSGGPFVYTSKSFLQIKAHLKVPIGYF